MIIGVLVILLVVAAMTVILIQNKSEDIQSLDNEIEDPDQTEKEFFINVMNSYSDEDPQIGELLSVNLPDIGQKKFLRVTCGTGRKFALPVPPEMETALEANAWTWGLEPNQYKPEVRT